MRFRKSISIFILTLLIISQIPVISFASGTIGDIIIMDHPHNELTEHDEPSSYDIEIDRREAIVQNFYAQVVDESHTTLFSNETVTWSLADNDNGDAVIISPIDGGTVEFVVSTNAQADTLYLVATSDTDSSVSAQIEITLKAPSVSSIEIIGDSVVYINKDNDSFYSYTTEILDPNGNPIDELVTWSIENPLDGVSIDGGGNLCVSSNASEGFITIKATSVADSRVYRSKQIQVTIHPSEIVSSITILGEDTIMIDPANSVSTSYVALVKNSLGDTLQGEGVTWELYDTYNGVNIDNNGVLTVSTTADKGYIVIKATSISDSSIYGTFMVKLSKPVSAETPILSSIEINGNISIYIDKTKDTTVQYSAIPKDQFNNEIPSEAVSWALKDPYAGVSINSEGLLTVSKTALVGTIGIIATSISDSNVKNILYVDLTDIPSDNTSEPSTDPSVPNDSTENSKYMTITGNTKISTNKYGNYLGIYEGVVKDSSGNIIEEGTELKLATRVSGVKLYRIDPSSTSNYKYYLECDNLSSSKSVVIQAISLNDNSITAQLVVTITSNYSNKSSNNDNLYWDDEEEVVSEEPKIIDAKVDRKIQLVGVEDTPLSAIMEHKYLDATQETNWDGTIKVKTHLDLKNVSKILDNKKSAKELIVPMQYNADEQMVEITSDAFSRLKEGNIALSISTKDVKLTVPTDIINLTQLSDAFRNDIKDIKIGLKVKSISQAEQDIMFGYKGDKKPITNIFNFELVGINKWGNELEIYDFGDKQVRGEFLYDNKNVEDIADLSKLNVYKYNEDTKEWEYRKSKVDTQKSKVIFYTSTFSNYAIFEYNPSFIDLDNHWAKDYVEFMASKHIINGTGFGIFNPNGTITRAEFVALVVRALDLKGEGNHSFADIPRVGWYNNTVGLAVKYNLILEGENKEFRPNDKITREEMASIIARAYDVLISNNSITPFFGLTFKDINNVSPWALESVNKVSALGIIQGYGGNFYPLNTATRAEGATIIYRLLKVTDNI